MLEIVIIFLLVSVFLYCLLGGADFGAGILEFTAGKKTKKITSDLVTKAIAPIWEANHMWLIIVVVILFNGFPLIYTSISVSLYIPLILLLVGIVLRGTAFSFRHYDAIKDESYKIYTRIFAFSSVLVPIFLGLIVGAVVSGKITSNPANYFEAYINPWLNLFSISVGLFICSLFALMAAIFLISESTDENSRKIFITKSKRANIAVVAAGALVFISSLMENVDFAERFFSHPVSITLIILATISLPVTWKILEKGKIWFSRFLAGTQLLLITGAFYAVYYPTIVIIKESENLTLFNSAAPLITLTYLGWSLIIGIFIIFPLLFYMFKIFKLEKS